MGTDVNQRSDGESVIRSDDWLAMVRYTTLKVRVINQAAYNPRWVGAWMKLAGPTSHPGDGQDIPTVQVKTQAVFN